MPDFEIETESSLRFALDMLEAITRSAIILAEAERSGSIYFDDQIVPASFEIITQLMQRARNLGREELTSYIAHLRQDGPAVCSGIVEEIRRTVPPVLHSDYLSYKLVKPPSI